MTAHFFRSLDEAQITSAYLAFLGFQLISIFGSLLDRELIKKDFAPNYPKLVTMMEDELMRAKEIYDGYMAMRSETGKMSIHQNMPKVSGSLKWSSELRDRIASPMVSFKSMEHP